MIDSDYYENNVHNDRDNVNNDKNNKILLDDNDDQDNNDDINYIIVYDEI